MGKRDEARAETTERILAAARAEIARVGGVGLSMRSVAREVGMVSSAVYRYFPTREDLLTAMILESYGALAEALRAADSDGVAVAAAPAVASAAVTSAAASADVSARPDADRWTGLAEALRAWALRRPHEFQLVYGTPIPGYVAPPETIPAAGEVAAPFLDCLGTRWVPGFEQFEHADADDGLRLLAEDVGISPSAAAAVVAAISELVGFVAHELAGHFAGLAEPADDLYACVVDRQVRELGLACDLGLARTEGAEEWELRFVAELARALARGPGTQTMHPDDEGYGLDELSLEPGRVRLVWSFPGITGEDGRPIRAGRYLNLAELRAGFSPDGPDVVAGAVVVNDFYPARPPSADREQSDDIRWLGPSPQ